MNYIKAQKIIFDALCKGSPSVRKFAIGNDRIMVTPDGIRGFIFPMVAVNFNLEKIKDLNAFSFEEIIKPENEMRLTPDVRIFDNGREMYRRLKGSKGSTFVNMKYLDCFQNPKLFQAESKHSIIVVAEDASPKMRNVPVGVIMPVRSNWDDGCYYADDMKGSDPA